jgi:hypothetical protein
MSRDVECKCGWCGKEYTVPDWQKTGRQFCSRECTNQARKGWTYPARAERIEKTCPECGETFIAGGAGNVRRFQTYCSAACSQKVLRHHPEARQMLDTEASWLAAVLDGEGSIIRDKNRPPSTVRIAVYNTYCPLLDRVQEVTGTGKISQRDRGNPNHAVTYTWQCYGENARNLLEQMLPWLIVKRDKARIALGLEPDS